MTAQDELAELEREFGYRPDASREKWTIYKDSLIVADADRPPRLYRKGGGGVAWEMAPRT